VKIRTQKDVEELKSTITRELGVDVTKYRDEEVAENLVDLLVFPKYIVKWIGRPVLWALVLYVLGFFIIDLGPFEYILYGVFGLILFLLCGVFSGILNLVRKLEEDLSSISTYSLGVMKNSLLDIDDIGSRINKNNRKDVFNMLFNGIIHVVTIPMVSQAIDNKVPLAGGIIKGVVRKSLETVSDRLDFDDEKIDENTLVVDGDSKFVVSYTKGIDKATKGVTGSLSAVTRIVRLPFRILLYTTFIILALFVYFLW
jgi:hypothetical protein